MRRVTRARALASLAGLPLVAACSLQSGIRVGSKNFTESIVLAEIYAQALERSGMAVSRRFNLGSTQIMLAAMARGDIDLYPEYTGTALIDVLHLAPARDAAAIYRTVREAFARDYAITWLAPAPMNDSQGLATTRVIAQRYGLRTLSDLAPLASRLRLATIPEFVSRPDGIPGLQRVYGGFHFASVHTYDIALKYTALLRGDADIATAFTTDGAIATSHLVVLEDDKHLWPAYNPAPIVRSATLAKAPRIAIDLDAVSARITDGIMQGLNAAVEQGADPVDVATAFLKGGT